MIPDKIKIGGLEYECILEANLTRDGNATGVSCSNALQIKIDSSLPKENQMTTLLHEVIEQINYLNNINLDHTQISVLETNLYQVLKDNNLKFRG